MPPATASEQRDMLLAAQPIYDCNDKIRGFELLYRNDKGQSALDVGENRATSEVLFNLCTGITEQVEQFRQPAFINVSRDFLCSGAFLPIEPEQVVIELVERIEPDAEVIAAVEAWHSQGFRFALDDFEFKPSWLPLVRMASIIKVDIEQTPFDQVQRLRQELLNYPVQWLAERVETGEQRELYRQAGFDFFQGYFFARPAIIYGKKLHPASLNLARLIGLLFAEDPDINRITQVLSEDPSLSVNLIRIVNSPLYRGHYKIKSMREVVVRLGVNAIRRWALLIQSLQISSPETARLVLVRAQTCVALAEARPDPDLEPAQAFLAGLLSGADVLLGVELPVFLEELDVAEPVKAAALRGQGRLGKVVDLVCSLERRLALKQDIHKLNPRLVKLYRESAFRVQALFNEMV